MESKTQRPLSEPFTSTNTVDLKAIHFKDTDFGRTTNCAMAKALKEKFQTHNVTEGISTCSVELSTGWDKFQHEPYTRQLFNRDSFVAFWARLFGKPNKVIRTVQLTKNL